MCTSTKGVSEWFTESMSQCEQMAAKKHYDSHCWSPTAPCELMAAEEHLVVIWCMLTVHECQIQAMYRAGDTLGLAGIAVQVEILK